MSMLDKLFGRSKKKADTEPAIYFGRYSDNNKPVEKVNRWTDAENLFKEKKYPECFDSDIETANPSKLYYGLKELSTKGDKQDDLLVQDFSTLQRIDTEHIMAIPNEEKEIKYHWLQKWISETLSYVKTLDADKFSGGIAYLLLALAYRIDYLIVPEGTILHDLEKIVELYFKKDNHQTTEKNRVMMD